jgi:hypothetical protein
MHRGELTPLSLTTSTAHPLSDEPPAIPASLKTYTAQSRLDLVGNNTRMGMQRGPASRRVPSAGYRTVRRTPIWSMCSLEWELGWRRSRGNGGWGGKQGEVGTEYGGRVGRGGRSRREEVGMEAEAWCRAHVVRGQKPTV